MAVLRTCDRCKQTISYGIARSFFRRALTLRTVPKRNLDLCNDCIGELNLWLDNEFGLKHNLTDSTELLVVESRDEKAIGD